MPDGPEVWGILDPGRRFEGAKAAPLSGDPVVGIFAMPEVPILGGSILGAPVPPVSDGLVNPEPGMYIPPGVPTGCVTG